MNTSNNWQLGKKKNKSKILQDKLVEVSNQLRNNNTTVIKIYESEFQKNIEEVYKKNYKNVVTCDIFKLLLQYGVDSEGIDKVITGIIDNINPIYK